MGSSQYARELEQVRKKRDAAERKVNDYRTRESKKRADADKARAAAAKTKNATTRRSKESEARRRLNEAQAAASQAATWQNRVVTLAKKESLLRSKLSKAQVSEATKAEKQRERAHQAQMAKLRKQQQDVALRVTHAESSVRDVVHSLKPPKVEKLRILVLTSDPEGELRLGREKKRIRQAVRGAVHRDWVEFDFRSAATPEDLLDGLSEFVPHVVHFSGHSNPEGVFFEEDVDSHNLGRFVGGDVLTRALGAVDSPPSLVVLNSCESAAQLEHLVESTVPFAVGMADPINDGDAIVFAARFYAYIANGQSLSSAVAAGCVALEMAGLEGSELPVLVHAADADPSGFILVQAPESALDGTGAGK